MKTILRWCAVPFASSIGAYIAYLFVMLWIKGNNYGFEFYNGTKVGSITQIILAITAQAVFGYVFVYCGALVAPKHNRVCAIVLATILCTISAVGFIYSLLSYGFAFLQLVHILATMIAAVVSASMFESEESI